MIVFGVVPSRRLGRSLGINNIPPKICSYSCVYCQLGNTPKTYVDRQAFYKPEQVFREVSKKLADLSGDRVDYFTFVPDGEPTLDVNLGKTIELLKPFGIKIAVLTNGSLFFNKNVREDIANIHLVSLKIDAVSEKIWRRINRPHKLLKLNSILEGMLNFADEFKGEIITETMFIKGVNDKMEEIERIKNFLVELNPSRAYIAIPIRPPAEGWVKPADEQTVNLAYQVFSEALGRNKIEFLIGEEGNAFFLSGNIEEDLLSITSVHPMREDTVVELLRKAETDQKILEKLIREGKLIKLKYGKHNFYMRKILNRSLM